MNKSSAALALAIAMIGISSSIAFADTDRYEIWDQLDADTARLFNDQLIDESEDRDLEEILGLGRSGKIEESITALKAFSKGNRNRALRGVARNAYALLLKQQKEAADNWAKRAYDKPDCTLEMKVCSNGEIVGREGAQCTFVRCNGK